MGRRRGIAAGDVALVAPLLAAIDALNAEIKALDLELETLARETYPVTERLRQIPGVGPLTALCFVLTLEDPARFADARSAGPYLGLVPERDQSGQTDKQLGITKAGHVQRRCLLVILRLRRRRCDRRLSQRLAQAHLLPPAVRCGERDACGRAIRLTGRTSQLIVCAEG